MPADEQVVAALKALNDKQVRVLTGTVTSYSTNPQTVPVRLDGDTAGNAVVDPVIIPSICGTLPQGTRVSILTVPPAGMMIVGTIGTQFGLPQRQETLVWRNPVGFVASGNWTVPSDPLFLGVEVLIQSGGGGSGGTAANVGATDSSSSGGGQGGGFVRGVIPAGSLPAAGATVAVTVGAGGLAAVAGNNPGGTGGTSSFGAYLSIPGGAGGSGGGSGGGANNTTQLGGTSDQLAGLVVALGAALMDVQQGHDGGTGFRAGGGGNGIIMPGYGGGSRMGGMTAVRTRAAGQIPPASGWPLGGGASGRGIDAAGAYTAGTGAAGASGYVSVQEIYRS